MYQNPEPNDEMLECFDELGNIIESHTRQEIHGDLVKYWHGVVNIWLVNNQRQLLCSKRSETLKGNPGKWQTYFGGHVKNGATFKEAAIMELDEEVGLQVDEARLYLIDKGKNESSKHFYESYMYPFNGEVTDLNFNDGEITEVKWLSMEDYWQQKTTNPDNWCNNCSPGSQEKIKQYTLE